jgi:Tfp pilus assembly protein PilF
MSESAVLQAAAGHIAKNEYDQAIGLLEKFVGDQPKAGPDAFLMLVDCRMRKREPEAAMEAVRAGLERQPGSVALLKAGASILVRDRRHSASARDLLAKAVRLAPDDPETHYLYSQWACLHNQEELCIQEAQKALSLEPGNEAANLQLNTLIGMAADKLNRADQAEAAFRRSLASNRKLGFADPLAAYQYVVFLTKRGREDEAQSVVAGILARAPRFGPAHLERAKHLAKNGEHEQAAALAEQALKLEGMDKEKSRAAHLLLARTYFLLGREEDSARHQAWVEENPH